MLGLVAPGTTADFHAVSIQRGDLGMCKKAVVDEELVELAVRRYLVNERGFTPRSGWLAGRASAASTSGASIEVAI
ncbi:MAG: hypothetical protein IPH07_33385 [Deltaproteobacteria bacterium]|nr:hypothetical protein [Deltaproteobacteria bacterium]MBK8235077.1 hypothetical protein [Deltaproteobacteria bacterium]MBK8716610.1 hypothetical protein [Deltaproteobacteria bacterium]MBP7292286.1 hypothetical protein [Nannocystaceae bacterium]